MSYYLLVPALLFLVVLVLLIKRGSSYLVERFVTKQGGKILESRWTDFRPGKLRGGTVYKVHFSDRLGNEHQAYLRVNLLAGVHFEEDHIIKLQQLKAEQEK